MGAPDLTYLIEDQQRMAQARHYFHWQAKIVRREIGNRIIEVGSGIGNFTGHILDRELIIATDCEASCLIALETRYAKRPNLRAFALGAEDPRFETLSEFRPDTCICLNVLEHIEDDLAALLHMKSVLVSGGVVVLIVPAFPALFGPIDRNLHHYRRYRRATLAGLAAKAGFHVKKLSYMNFVGFFGWWVNARILKRNEQSAAQIALFDRCVVPTFSRIENIVPPPFGQSIFAVFEKP